ncbi:MAG: TolC family protein [Planctomycetales bacterium]|nr:TolC family protein [Planctomycetales bacterium]MCA9169634.1 TolC family protein [Planctomycetales bacterium]
MLALTFVSGCHGRHYYRKQAECEAQAVLAEKQADPRWTFGAIPLWPDPRSRFAEVQSVDCPCMPTDDPAALYLSPKPQRPDEVCPVAEGRGYLELLPPIDFTEDGSAGSVSAVQQDPLAPPDETPRVLSPRTAYEVGLINSREYQSRKESLYLAALDVTLERFAFGPQFFATQSAAYEHVGHLLPGGDRQSHLTLDRDGLGNVVGPGETPGSEAPNGQTVNSFVGPGPLAGSGLGVGKLFPSGAALLVQFANRTVFEFSGPFKGTFSQSELSLDVVQPLLQGGGQAVTLEPLTQAERNLLYELRSFARFQREFFVSVASGSDLDQGARLEVSQQSDQSSDGQRRRVGVLPLIEQLQTLRNEQRNLERLQEHLKRFEAFHRAEEVSLIQVDQVRQDVAQARSRVIRARQRYFSNLDRLKIQLGMPTDTPLVLDESTLAQFELNETNCRLPYLPEELAEINVDGQSLAQTALSERLDLMNSRAALVDYWRKIAVSANGLLGVLDVSYNGSWLTTDPIFSSQPLDFDASRGRHRVGLNMELPLVRKRERNIYFATLIEYQQARRRLMLAEDTVKLEVRSALRSWVRARENFEIQREAVLLACRRVDQARRILELPPRANEVRDLGPNAARNLLEAQQDLVDAQNDLVQSWVDFQIARLELLRDLESLDVNDPANTEFTPTSLSEELPVPPEPLPSL